jgi:hypothetical protein
MLAALTDAALDSWLLKRGSGGRSAFKQGELEGLPAWRHLMAEAKREAQQMLAELPSKQREASRRRRKRAAPIAGCGDRRVPLFATALSLALQGACGPTTHQRYPPISSPA